MGSVRTLAHFGCLNLQFCSPSHPSDNLVSIHNALIIILFVLLGLASAAPIPAIESQTSDYGYNKFNVGVVGRSYFVVNNMDEGLMEKKLESCSELYFKTWDFAFAH